MDRSFITVSSGKRTFYHLQAGKNSLLAVICLQYTFDAEVGLVTECPTAADASFTTGHLAQGLCIPLKTEV
jgi:hypothetical protein